MINDMSLKFLFYAIKIIKQNFDDKFFYHVSF